VRVRVRVQGTSARYDASERVIRVQQLIRQTIADDTKSEHADLVLEVVTYDASGVTFTGEVVRFAVPVA